MRRTIARRLVESKQTVPHFYLSTDIDIQRMLELRQRVNDSGSIKISVNDFVVKAYAQALMAFPAANAAWAEDGIFRFARANFGVGVAVAAGLVTPAVLGAASKGLLAMAAEVGDLAERDTKRNP